MLGEKAAGQKGRHEAGPKCRNSRFRQFPVKGQRPNVSGIGKSFYTDFAQLRKDVYFMMYRVLGSAESEAQIIQDKLQSIS